MRALIATQPGPPDVMGFVERPTPTPSANELLVQVFASAVNRADINQRKGSYDLPPGSTDVFGLELAGQVVAIGSEVEGWAAGDRVCALVPGGGHAEFAVVPTSSAMPIPEAMSYEQASAVPEVFLTAYDNLRRRGRLTEGEIVLIHGGASGVGTAAIQMARRWGARTFVTCRSSKREACLELGAHEAIDYEQEDFVARVGELTDRRGVDVVLDHLGGSYLARNLDAMAMDGRLIIIGTMGAKTAELDLRKVMSRRLHITGTRLRPRPDAEKAALIAAFRDELWTDLENGLLRPVVDSVVDWERIGEAHERMESSEHVGKLVLRITHGAPTSP